ncbi:hypothetical protein GCM10011588_72450 [Nocardia jinanensis]|uniref:Uncharacterized protein n=1 Tax=Nocardia jinanensis TaxID=382504 RepID=A0A917RZT9_9NOCA|nr:hypothetical protein GCM10011588_72450 [Nocardia jinanensis]
MPLLQSVYHLEAHTAASGLDGYLDELDLQPLLSESGRPCVLRVDSARVIQLDPRLYTAVDLSA